MQAKDVKTITEAPIKTLVRYHSGILSIDREEDATLHVNALRFLIAAEDGNALLFQRKSGKLRSSGKQHSFLMDGLPSDAMPEYDYLAYRVK